MTETLVITPGNTQITIATELESTLTTFLSNFMSKETQKAYVADWRDFFLYLAGKGQAPKTPDAVTEIQVISYRDHLRERYSPTTIARKLSALSSLFSRLKDEQLVRKNPVQGLRRPKAIVKRRRTGFTDQEVNRILESFDITTLKGLNDRALLSFLFYTGARITEALSVRVKDIETQEGIPVVHLRGKGEKLRTLPIVKTWTVVEQLIRQREKKEDDYVFTPVRTHENTPITRVSVHKLIKSRLKKLGLDPSRSAHSARRTVISNLLEAGERLELVQKVAGHSSPNVTLRSYNIREEGLAKNPLLNLRYRE